MNSKFIRSNVNKSVLIVFIIAVFFLGVVYFIKTSNTDLNKVPSGTEDLTTKRGGTIHAKVFCIENDNKIPCKGGLSIKSKIVNDQPIVVRTSDENGNLTASFEIGEYLLSPLPSSNPKYSLEGISLSEIRIEQGKVTDVEILYSSVSR